jgi:phage shock protein E
VNKIDASKLQLTEVTLIDVRSPEEFAVGHIEGALNIPLDKLEQGLEQLSKDQPVVTYCMMKHPGDSRGERAAKQLEALGFEASLLEGGFPAWQALHKKSEE